MGNEFGFLDQIEIDRLSAVKYTAIVACAALRLFASVVFNCLTGRFEDLFDGSTGFRIGRATVIMILNR